MSENNQFLSEQEYDLLRREKCRDLTDDQFAVFRHAIERFRLDPFGNQIYFQLRLDKRSGKKNITIQTGIDGYRLIADRTERYAGNDDPAFDNETNPSKATVAVYKIVGGQRCAFTATARWDQYFPGDTQGMMWKRMPHLMLGKCAEALALRKAFPAELAGLYTTEEMQQADREIATPAPAGNGHKTPEKPQTATDKESACNKAIADATTVNRVLDLHLAAKERFDGTPILGRVELKMGAKIVELLSAVAETSEKIEELKSWGELVTGCELLTVEQQKSLMNMLLDREGQLEALVVS